jgi:gliding motility-associated-like protein
VLRDFSIVILDVNEIPSDIQLSNNSVKENEPISTQVGVLTMVDQDENETSIFRLVSGANSSDNALFSISQNVLNTESVLDFEAKANYTIRVEVEDKGGLKFSRTFNISAIDVNDAPTDISVTQLKVPENKVVGALVGIMTSADQDKDEQFSYSLVSGNGDANNESFRIVNTELQSNTIFNFELKSSYSIRMRSRDRAGATFDKVFSITIEDANDNPTDIVFETDPEIVSSKPLGILVGKLKTIDEDANDTYRYDLIGGADGADNSLFRISGNDLLTNAILKDQPEILIIAVRVTDKGNLQLVKSFSITVTPSNRKPEAKDQTLVVREDAAFGESFGQLIATDPDESQVLEFVILNEASLERTSPFVLQPNGEMVVEKPEFLDILLEDYWEITVRVSDNGSPSLFADFKVSIKLEHVPGKSLPFNNYLSPNGDTKNDLLVIEQIEKYPNNSIAIYDNTGQQLYFQTNYQNNWDGTYKGNRLPKGSYTVVFKNETTGKVLRSSFAILY